MKLDETGSGCVWRSTPGGLELDRTDYEHGASDALLSVNALADIDGWITIYYGLPWSVDRGSITRAAGFRQAFLSSPVLVERSSFGTGTEKRVDIRFHRWNSDFETVRGLQAQQNFYEPCSTVPACVILGSKI